MLQVVLRPLAWLPLRALHGCGAALGWVVYLFSRGYATRLDQNLRQSGLYRDVKEYRRLRRRAIAEAGKLLLEAPVITGDTPVKEREALFAAFRTGEFGRLVVSKVANFSIDLPEANVAIQVSGTFGSRQEEAQRLGRILRPKADGGRARFYTVVSRDTNDTEYAQRRQRFLAEQGYAYQLVDATEVLATRA